MKPRLIAMTVLAVALLLKVGVGVGRSQDDGTRKHLLHQLGGSFFVSRDPVQQDLKLSDEQKQKLTAQLSAFIQETKTVESLPSADRESAMKSLRQTSYPKLETFLREIFTADQLHRFQQLKLQYDMPSIMLQPEVGNALHISDDQRKQFMGLMQGMQKEIVPLMNEAKAKGNPKEVLPKVIKLRQDCQAKMEALLSEEQKKQWKDMVGSPLEIW